MSPEIANGQPDPPPPLPPQAPGAPQESPQADDQPADAVGATAETATPSAHGPAFPVPPPPIAPLERQPSVVERAEADEEPYTIPTPSTICPYLALRDDSATAAAYAREDHVCTRTGAAAAIHERYQTTFCIGDQFQFRTCQVFVGKREQPPGPAPSWTAIGRRLRNRVPLPATPLQWALLGLFVVLVPAVLGTVVALMSDDEDDLGIVATVDETSAIDATAPADDPSPAAESAAAAQEPAGEGSSTEEAAPADTADVDAATPAAAVAAEEQLTPLEQLEAWPVIQEWTVRSGDSVAAIAREFGTTIEAIAIYNQLDDPGRIFEGQVLDVPIGFALDLAEPETSEEPVEPTPAAPIDPFVAAIVALPPAVVEAVRAWPNQIPWPVQEGDLLSDLASEFGTSVEAIAVLNGITNPNQIAVGTVLNIPVAFSVDTVVPQPAAEAAPTEEPPAEGDSGSETPAPDDGA